MGNIANLQPKPFTKDYQPARNGRPRKLISKFTNLGYKNSEVNDCLKNLLALTENELKQIEKDDEATALEKMMAGAILKDLKDKTFYTFQPILDKVFGKPKETIEVQTEPLEEQKARELYQRLVTNRGWQAIQALEAVKSEFPTVDIDLIG